jgi:hypothetical protein
MTKSFLAIVLLVARCAPAFSQTAGTDSVAVLMLTEARIDQALLAKQLQKAQHIPKIGVQYLEISPFTLQELPQYESQAPTPVRKVQTCRNLRLASLTSKNP